MKTSKPDRAILGPPGPIHGCGREYRSGYPRLRWSRSIADPSECHLWLAHYWKNKNLIYNKIFNCLIFGFSKYFRNRSIWSCVCCANSFVGSTIRHIGAFGSRFAASPWPGFDPPLGDSIWHAGTAWQSGTQSWKRTRNIKIFKKLWIPLKYLYYKR